ncbi:UPF0547 protein C16orf87 homolog isoform X1 [Brachyistius frenatus]|uniref:UPF0547 protein C16orf87 homolog isoform X1 n=1 Tax=Brachyistius frenatus TaxID=100188 RepID=UPI0037E84F9A
MSKRTRRRPSVAGRGCVVTVKLVSWSPEGGWWEKPTMSANKTKKVKMATKSCPECDQQIPVACKSCPCGYVFISRKLLNAKLNERSSPAIADKLDFKRRRTERIRRERIDSPLTNDMENRRRPRANSQSDPIRRGRGRPKTVGLKKQEEEKAGEGGGYLRQSLRREGLCVFCGLGRDQPQDPRPETHLIDSPPTD